MTVVETAKYLYARISPSTTIPMTSTTTIPEGFVKFNYIGYER